MFRLFRAILRPYKEQIEGYLSVSQSARYTYLTLDLFLLGPEDGSREPKHVAQR